MTDQRYPVDPMAAFFAAVTAVENGDVGEIELDFRYMSETENYEITMTMAIRREPRSYVITPSTNQGDSKDD